MNKQLTLCFVYQHPRILLGYKKRGFGAGRWNGFGGKVEAGETHEAAALRELAEEAGIHARETEKLGALTFSFEGEDEALDVHIFRTGAFDGEPRESEEMRPQWFYVDEIPFREMWPDDPYWFPYLLRGSAFTGAFHFRDHDTILSREVRAL